MNDPLVFLPGMMCDARLFTPQLEAFSYERAVIVIPISEHSSIDLLAHQVLAVAPPKFALLGLSMGGIVAMEVVRQAPGRVTRLALFDTNSNAELASVSAGREAQIKAAKNGHLVNVMRNEMKPNYLANGPNKSGILDLCMSMADALGSDVFVRQSIALRDREDQNETLEGIKVPTLILCGEEDILCPPQRHCQMAETVPNAVLKIIENAGHLPTLENPSETNKAIFQWLN